MENKNVKEREGIPKKDSRKEMLMLKNLARKMGIKVLNKRISSIK